MSYGVFHSFHHRASWRTASPVPFRGMLLTRQSVLPRLAPTAHWLPDKARGIFHPFCHCTSWRTNGVFPSPRCHRACGFYRTRRPPERVSPLAFLTTADRIPRLHIRQGRTLRHLSSCGPSPCTRLSRALTTMATLTPI